MQRQSLISSTDLAAALTRMALGVMYLSHAALKIWVFTLPGTVRFFATAGFPGWTAYPVVIAELVGGLMLLVGWHVRWVAICLVPILLGAIFVHSANGWVFSANGGGWEFPAYLTIWSLAQALLGGGAFAWRDGDERVKQPTPGRRAAAESGPI